MLTIKSGIVLPAVGDAWLGGYFAGVIDTTRPGSILAGDAATTGQRRALIVGPKSMEGTLATRHLDSVSSRNIPFQTRWDGLTATQMMAAQSTGYEWFKYINGLSYPTDIASQWYIGALDELDVVWKAFKPDTGTNYSPGSSNSGDAPATSQVFGYNPSSDPQWLSGYTSGNPAQTSVALFKSGGAQAFSLNYMCTSTQYSSTTFWRQGFASIPGGQGSITKTYSGSNYGVRPLRCVIL